MDPRLVTGLSIRYSDGTSLDLEGEDAREVMEQINLHIARSLAMKRRSRLDTIFDSGVLTQDLAKK